MNKKKIYFTKDVKPYKGVIFVSRAKLGRTCHLNCQVKYSTIEAKVSLQAFMSLHLGALEVNLAPIVSYLTWPFRGLTL